MPKSYYLKSTQLDAYLHCLVIQVDKTGVTHFLD